MRLLLHSELLVPVSTCVACTGPAAAAADQKRGLLSALPSCFLRELRWLTVPVVLLAAARGEHGCS